MKEIKKEITTYTTAYVSVDGKEFQTAEACREWENSYRRTIESSWQMIKKKEVCDSDFGLPYCSDDHECYAMKPKSLEEIAIINAYIEATTTDPGKLTHNDIGELIILNFGYDHDYCDRYYVKENLRLVTEKCENLAKEFNEE